MALMEISVVPLGTSSPSVSDFIAKALKIIKDSGLKYELTPMATVIEGDIPQLLKIVEQIHSSLFDDQVKRIVTTIKIDDRRDKKITFKSKVQSVLKKLD